MVPAHVPDRAVTKAQQDPETVDHRDQEIIAVDRIGEFGIAGEQLHAGGDLLRSHAARDAISRAAHGCFP